MHGIIVQFRRGRHRVTERHYLLDIGLSSREEGATMSGKKVTWVSPAGKEIHGKIAAPHGTKGLVRAIFEKGLPGQAITTTVVVDADVPAVKEEKKAKERKK